MWAAKISNFFDISNMLFMRPLRGTHCLSRPPHDPCEGSLQLCGEGGVVFYEIVQLCDGIHLAVGLELLTAIYGGDLT